MSHLATLSNGETIDHPRFYRKAEKELARKLQALSRKKRGSHRRDKARKLVAKAHKKIANRRQDFLHKSSRQLVDRYQVIVFEDLQTATLTKAPKPKQETEAGEYLPNGAAAKGGLNTSMLDAGWGWFVALTSYKAASAGREVRKVNPATPRRYARDVAPCARKNSVNGGTLASVVLNWTEIIMQPSTFSGWEAASIRKGVEAPVFNVGVVHDMPLPTESRKLQFFCQFFPRTTPTRRLFQIGVHWKQRSSEDSNW